MITQSLALLSPRIRPWSALPRTVVESALAAGDAWELAARVGEVLVGRDEGSGEEQAARVAANQSVRERSKAGGLRRER